MPVATTSVGGALVALLEAEFGSRRAGDLLRYLRGALGVSRRAGRLVRARAAAAAGARSAAAALELWAQRCGELPTDLELLSSAVERPPATGPRAGRSPPMAAARWPPRCGAARGAASWSCAQRRRSPTRWPSERELEGLAPEPDGARASRGRRSRYASGRARSEGRVRIADPYRLRAARFDHVFVASLQDGEFPAARRPRRPVPLRGTAGVAGPRRPAATPKPRSAISSTPASPCRAGGSTSPTATATRTGPPRRARPCSTRCGACSTAPPATKRTPTRSRQRDPGARARRGRPPGRRRTVGGPSWRARSPRTGPAADRGALLTRRRRRGRGRRSASATRLEAARAAELATRAPGPLSNPAVIDGAGRRAGLRRHHAGGLRPLLLPLVRLPRAGAPAARPRPRPARPGRDHARASSSALYRERPGGDALPRPGSLAGLDRGAAASSSPRSPSAGLGDHPAERAMLRRVEGLLARFLAEEAARDPAACEPWLLEAAFGEDEECRAAALEIDGWGLHGAIDRVDRAADGRALVIDYKLSGRVTPREKLEEQAKLQLQLYLVARRRALGRGGDRRDLSPAAGDLRAPAARGRPRRSGGAARLLRPLPDRPRRPRGARGAARGRPPAGGRDRRAHAAAARSTATRGRGRVCAATASARPTATSRRSAAATAPRSRREDEDEEGRGERPRPDRGAGGGDRAPATARSCVEAGAGTGKTGVMVDRYCRLVCEQDVPLDAVLAFTFTEKAAAELRQRIRAELARRAEAGLGARRRAARRGSAAPG